MTWATDKLGGLCLKVCSGGTPLRSIPEYYENGSIPWLKTGEVKKGIIFDTEEKISESGLENSSAKLVPTNSVIVAMYGDGDTAGNVAINKVPLTTNQACCNFTLDPKKAHYRFVYFYLKGSYNNLINLKLGGSQQNLNAQSLKSFPITHPRIEVQEKIAAILSAYDDLIENNRRRIALLEKMAEELYREWFVRMRFPGHDKVKKVKGVPEGWKEQKFGQFCQLQRGFDLTDAEVEPGPYPVIASTSIKTYHSQYKVEPPIITTGRSGSLGEVLFVNSRAWPHNTALYVKNFFGNSVFLVYYTLKNMQLENFNAGAGVPTLNRNHLNGISIVVPSKEIQNQFDGVVSQLHAQTELLKNANQKLTTTRDLLLPRLISGKLSVEHLDIQFPPSMMEAA